MFGMSGGTEVGIYSSKKNAAFYADDIHDALPDDALPISDELHLALLEGQVMGRRIDFSGDSGPVLADPLPLTSEQLAKAARDWRDWQLSTTDSIVARHRDEIEAGGETTLPAEQYKALQAYRNSLRNWPSTADFPNYRPVSPL